MKEIKFYIPKNAKACDNHLNCDNWLIVDVEEGEQCFSNDQIEDIIDLLRMEQKLCENTSPGIICCTKKKSNEALI